MKSLNKLLDEAICAFANANDQHRLAKEAAGFARNQETARHQYFETREDARFYCASVGRIQKDIQRNTPGCVKERRWFV